MTDDSNSIVIKYSRWKSEKNGWTHWSATEGSLVLGVSMKERKRIFFAEFACLLTRRHHLT